MEYNPNKLVELFIQEHGDLGRHVLQTFNHVDPLEVYYGDEVNPDEYLGYAKRFCSLPDLDLRERFEQSFHASQHGEVQHRISELVDMFNQLT